VPAASPIRVDPSPALRRRYRGCLVGGAIGDALGAPVEFMALEEIQSTFGEGGIQEFTTAFDRKGAITDDTQLALFTAEGLLRAYVRESTEGSCNVPVVVANAYLRWLKTQGTDSPLLEAADGWLVSQRALHVSRVPAATCLEAIGAMSVPGERARNKSKGCIAAARVAPVGLFCAREPGATPERAARRAFDIGCETAALTHGHPTAQLAAGAFAALIALLAREATLFDAIAKVKTLLARRPLHEETSRAIERAQSAAISGTPGPRTVVGLGEGWNSEEALAIALYASLVGRNFESGVRMAVNHDGDSDSTGAMAGSLLGTLHGLDAIPRRWGTALEAKDVIVQIADDLATYPDWPVGQYVPAGEANSYWLERYPGW
jgi:ADP-ribosylglycohydrolase